MKILIVVLCAVMFLLAYLGIVLALRRGGVKRKEYRRALHDQQTMTELLQGIELAVVDYLDPIKGDAYVLALNIRDRILTERTARYKRNSNSKVNA